MKLGEAADWAEELVKYARANPEHLTEWQQDFVSSYGEKVDNFQEECFVSEKQLDQLDKIAEALGVDKCDRSKLDDD